MSDVHDRIEECIEAFAADMSEIVRRVAFDSVSRALAGQPAIAPAATSASGRGGMQRNGTKRTRDQIARTIIALENHLRATPGRRMEELSGDLGLSSRELALPLRRLVETGRVRAEGQKRATRYFPI